MHPQLPVINPLPRVYLTTPPDMDHFLLKICEDFYSNLLLKERVRVNEMFRKCTQNKLVYLMCPE